MGNNNFQIVGGKPAVCLANVQISQVFLFAHKNIVAIHKSISKC